MAKQCVNCGQNFPWEIKIDGKTHKLNARKYCLDCSPFAQHNTKRIHIKRDQLKCKYCGGSNPKNGKICYSCGYKRKWNKRLKAIYDIVGTACWYCGYDKGIKATPVLDFHHINPETKKFCINRRGATAYELSEVWIEMQKCALLCCRCHREVHFGIIHLNDIEKIYKNKWNAIINQKFSLIIRRI